jgi:hypothetical protein
MFSKVINGSTVGLYWLRASHHCGAGFTLVTRPAFDASHWLSRASHHCGTANIDVPT